MARGVMRASDGGRLDVVAISAIGGSLPEAGDEGLSSSRPIFNDYRNRGMTIALDRHTMTACLADMTFDQTVRSGRPFAGFPAGRDVVMRCWVAIALPPLLAVTLGLSGCPTTIPSPFVRTVAITLANPAGSAPSLTQSFVADLTLFPDASSMNWEFGDGSQVRGISPANGQRITHDYRDNGNFTVKVYVFNRQAMLGQGELAITVKGPNHAPTASFAASPGAGPRTFSFDASASSDSDGSIASFSWDFGDFSGIGSGQAVEHTYLSSGSFTVTLTVTDDQGATGRTTRIVTANIPPTADFTFQSAGAEAPDLLNVSFDGSASSDSDGSIASFSWDFGDSTPAGSGATPQHTYGIQGIYDVTLTVTDNFGATATKMQSLNLKGTLPFISGITPSNGVVDTTVSISDLAGGNFVAGATVRLTRSGQTDINATGVNVVTDSKITCSFDLTGAQLGDWNVIVRNPDLHEATLTAGFRVVTPDRVRLTTNKGDIVLQMDAAHAPGTVTNFLRYVDASKFDDIVFHRVPKNPSQVVFVIQAGAFKSLGAGANPRLEEVEGFDSINGEPHNGLSNVRGTIAMALRGQDVNSASNQWYINTIDNTNLDNGPPPFTVFGKVIEGLSVVDAIAAVATANNVPVMTLQGPATFNDVPVDDVTIIMARRE